MSTGIRIALVSDTHLAARAAAFNANWQAARDWIGTNSPDHVIHLGDISAAGDEDIDDLRFAAASLANLACPLWVLPGNHDVGDNPSTTGVDGAHLITAERLLRYRTVFGADRWTFAAGRWRLIGLNAQLFGTGSREEEDQFEWLETELPRAAEAPLGLLLHKPLFRDSPDDDEPGERYVPVAPRARLLQLLRHHDLRFVLSGHTHQARQLHAEGIDHLWVPSTSFCIPDAVQETIGRKLVGCVMLTLDDNGHRFETLTPPGMLRHNLLDHAEVYPQVAPLKARIGAAARL